MKKFNYLFLSLLAATALLFTSCSDDENEEDPAGPSVDFISASGLVTGDVTVEPGDTINVRLSISKGDKNLDQLAVEEDGNNMSGSNLARLWFDGTVSTENPIDIDEGTIDIAIITDGVDGESTEYSFVVSDRDGLKGTQTITVTTENPGTPVTEATARLLSNAAGPTGTGGIDLETGNGTGSIELSADIIDLGIDNSQVAADNWRQMINAANGSEIKTSSVTYASITTQEEIVAAFNGGTAIDAAGVMVSDGDEFIVKSGTDYYFISVTDVVVTAADNTDYYELSIKQ